MHDNVQALKALIDKKSGASLKCMLPGSGWGWWQGGQQGMAQHVYDRQ
jgi:hypothetical protein